MKIGFVLDDSLDKYDGVQQYVLQLGKWLNAQGHGVHYLVGETKRTDIGGLHSLARNLSVRFNRNRMSVPLPANSGAIDKVLELENFDVLHVQMPYSPWLSGKIIRRLPSKTALVGTFHIAPFSTREAFLARLLGLWLKPTLRRFDMVLSVSEAAQLFAKHSFKLNSLVLPNVVDLSFFKTETPKNTNGQYQLLFLGRLVERKGCQNLIAALPLVKQTNWHLKIAGDGPLSSQLQDQVSKLGLNNRVDFVGIVSETEKARLLAQSDLAIFPSLGGESFGIVLIEAMAAGAGVVLGGKNPGYESVLSTCPEALFDPKNSKKLAKLIDEFTTKKNLQRSTHAAQQALVKKFDVSSVGPKLLNIYSQAIAKRGKSSHNRAKYEPAW